MISSIGDHGQRRERRCATISGAPPGRPRGMCRSWKRWSPPIIARSTRSTPLRAKGILLAALAYFILPVDTIPDVIFGTRLHRRHRRADGGDRGRARPHDAGPSACRQGSTGGARLTALIPALADAGPIAEGSSGRRFAESGLQPRGTDSQILAAFVDLQASAGTARPALRRPRENGGETMAKTTLVQIDSRFGNPD